MGVNIVEEVCLVFLDSFYLLDFLRDLVKGSDLVRGQNAKIPILPSNFYFTFVI